MPRSKSYTARKIFGEEGARFARLLRRLLPVASQLGPTAQRARRLLQTEAERTSERMVKAGRDWARVSMPAAFASGKARAARDMAGLAQLQFGQVNVRLAQRLAQDVARDLAVAGASPERYYAQALRVGQATMANQEGGPVLIDRSLTAIMARGVLEREAPAALRRRLMNELGLEDGDRVLLLNGQKWDATAYMNLVARTRTAEAANLGYAEEVRSKGYDFIKTSEHGGVEPDDICYVLQGRVFAMEPNDLGIPVLPAEWGLPPWHPNCRHTFGVWVPDLEGGKAIKAAARATGSLEKGLNRLAEE